MTGASRRGAADTVGSTRRLPVEVPVDHPAFDGHFPGQPVWPGVCLLAEVLEAVIADPACVSMLPLAGAARADTGGAPAVAMPVLSSAKFLAPVRPGDALVLELSPTTGGFSFSLHQGARCVARGQFGPPVAARMSP